MSNLFLVLNLVFFVLGIVYQVYMVMYLTDAKKCDKHMSKRDANFRKVALVITWVILTIYALVIISAIVSGMISYRLEVESSSQ